MIGFSCPSASTPYSDTCSPPRTAASRNAALWGPEPVKCWSRLPSCAALAIRKSTEIPEWVRALRAGLAGGGNVLDLSQPREALRERRRLARGCDQVDVLHAVCHPPRRPRDLHVGARTASLEQPGGERLAQLQRARQEQPSARSLGWFGRHPVEPREHAFLELCAESPHGPQPLRQRRLAQLLGRVDPQLGEQQSCALGPQPRQSRDRDQAWWELRAHPLRRGRRAGVEQRDDLLLERRSDPRELGRAAGAGQRGDRDGRLAHRLRRVAVGEHAVDDRPVELVQVAELLQRVGNRGVREVHCSRVRERMSNEPWLILPTYNEAENIEAIVVASGEALRGVAPEGWRVLVVDDGSPDGTGEIADRLAAEHDWVEVLHRAEKNGIGPAYLAGFRHALDHGAGYVMEMDSDFSHNPADLARLLEAVKAGADLALGSRYVPGGGVVDWGLLRRVISEGGSTYARIVLGLRVKDLTGGFKCFRREVLEEIHFDGVRSQGYAFQVELTYRAVRAGFKVVEVPIVFKDRLRGQSKMSWRIATEAMWLVPQLRFR